MLLVEGSIAAPPSRHLSGGDANAGRCCSRGYASRMSLADVCVHTAVPLRTTTEGARVEGEVVAPEPEPATEASFDCCLFLPLGQESEDAGGRRNVKHPTLLYLPEDWVGVPVVLAPEDSLLVTAPELNLARGLDENVAEEWRIDGAPQPFGPPGDAVIGWQARLLSVT